MRELEPGLWHWEELHPQWEGSTQYGQPVSSYAMDDGRRLLLFDPMPPPGEILGLAGERETARSPGETLGLAGEREAIVLTNPWHERDTQNLVERLGVPVFTPPRDTAEDLMQKYGITAEEAGDGSPDIRWLLDGDAGEFHLYSAGDRLPVGVEAYPGREHNDLALWIESRRTAVIGDSLADFGSGLEFPAMWTRKNRTRKQIVEDLRPLLELPVERVLAAHGGPFDRAALERALA